VEDFFIVCKLSARQKFYAKLQLVAVGQKSYIISAVEVIKNFSLLQLRKLVSINQIVGYIKKNIDR